MDGQKTLVLCFSHLGAAAELSHREPPQHEFHRSSLWKYARAYMTVKHTVGHYGVLRSSNAPTFLWNFMLIWTHLYLYLSLTFKLQGRKHAAGFLCFIAENSISSVIKTATVKQKMSLLSSYETIISKLLLCDMSLICKTTDHQLKLPARCTA